MMRGFQNQYDGDQFGSDLAFIFGARRRPLAKESFGNLLKGAAARRQRRKQESRSQTEKSRRDACG
jgi:hypothetical protein